MQKYDAMYIIRPDVEEDARNSLIAEISAIFTDRGATNLEVKNGWGLRAELMFIFLFQVPLKPSP